MHEIDTATRITPFLSVATKMSKRKASSSVEVEDKLGQKKARSDNTVQTTMFKFFQPSTPSQTPMLTVATTPESYGIHIYTPTEISKSQGLQQMFRKYWNEKAHELCADTSIRCKLKNKSAIQGAIYCSWTLHKTHLLQLQAEELQEDVKRFYPEKVAQEHMLTPVTKNLDRMLIAYATATCLYSEMNDGSEDLRKLETDLEREVSELRKAQDALSKAMERRRLDINISEREMSDLLRAESPDPVQISDTEMQQIVDIIKVESQAANYVCESAEETSH